MVPTGTTAVLAILDRPAERPEARDTGDAEGRFAGLMAQYVQPASPPQTHPGRDQAGQEPVSAEPVSADAPGPRPITQAPATESQPPSEATSTEVAEQPTHADTVATLVLNTPEPGTGPTLAGTAAAAPLPTVTIPRPTASAALPAVPSSKPEVAAATPEVEAPSPVVTTPSPAAATAPVLAAPPALPKAMPSLTAPAVEPSAPTITQTPAMAGGTGAAQLNAALELPGLSAVLAVTAPPSSAPAVDSGPGAVEAVPAPTPKAVGKAGGPGETSISSAASSPVASRAQVTFTLSAPPQPTLPSLRAADLRSSRLSEKVAAPTPTPERAAEPTTQAARPEAAPLTEAVPQRPESLGVLPQPTLLQTPPGAQTLSALTAPAPFQVQPSGAAPVAPQTSAAVPVAPPVTQVEGGIRWMLKGGAQEARLQLHPEALGQVTIHLKVDGGEVHARLWITEPASVQAVQEGRHHLEQSLKEQGLLLGSFDLQQGHRPFQEAPSAPTTRESSISPASAARQEPPAAPALSILNAHHVELYA